jgi:hypothetical protein
MITIEGSRQELDPLRKSDEQDWSVYHLRMGYKKADVYFIEREPTLHIKSLSELAAEYGNNIKLSKDLSMIDVCKDGLFMTSAELKDLGKSWPLNYSWVPSDLWKSIFLKEDAE